MKKITAKFLVYIILAIIGAALFLLSAADIIDDFFGGYGAGLLCLGILRIIWFVRYKNDAEYAKKTDIERGDERNIYIAKEARSFAFVWGVLILSALVVVFRIMNLDAYSVFCGYIVLGFMSLYLISYYTYKARN